MTRKPRHRGGPWACPARKWDREGATAARILMLVVYGLLLGMAILSVVSALEMKSINGQRPTN